MAGRIFSIESVRSCHPGKGNILRLKVNFMPEIITLAKEVSQPLTTLSLLVHSFVWLSLFDVIFDRRHIPNKGRLTHFPLISGSVTTGCCQWTWLISYDTAKQLEYWYYRYETLWVWGPTPGVGVFRQGEPYVMMYLPWGVNVSNFQYVGSVVRSPLGGVVNP